MIVIVKTETRETTRKKTSYSGVKLTAQPRWHVRTQHHVVYTFRDKPLNHDCSVTSNGLSWRLKWRESVLNLYEKAGILCGTTAVQHHARFTLSTRPVLCFLHVQFYSSKERHWRPPRRLNSADTHSLVCFSSIGMYRIAIFKIWPEPDITGYQMNYPAGTRYLNTCCVANFFGFVCGMNKKVLFPVLVVFSFVRNFIGLRL